MSTVATTVSKAERIGKAVAEVAKRVRIQDFDVVSISGQMYSGADDVRISIQLDTRRDLHRAATYFRLYESKELAGDTTLYAAQPVPGLFGATVEVYGPGPESDR